MIRLLFLVALTSAFAEQLVSEEIEFRGTKFNDQIHLDSNFIPVPRELAYKIPSFGYGIFAKAPTVEKLLSGYPEFSMDHPKLKAFSAGGSLSNSGKMELLELEIKLRFEHTFTSMKHSSDFTAYRKKDEKLQIGPIAIAEVIYLYHSGDNEIASIIIFSRIPYEQRMPEPKVNAAPQSVLRLDKNPNYQFKKDFIEIFEALTKKFELSGRSESTFDGDLSNFYKENRVFIGYDEVTTLESQNTNVTISGLLMNKITAGQEVMKNSLIDTLQSSATFCIGIINPKYKSLLHEKIRMKKPKPTIENDL